MLTNTRKHHNIRVRL